MVSRDAEDKGTVPAGTSVSRRITLRNVSTSPVRIEVHRRSCACLAPVVEPDRIEPGQTASLTFGAVAAAAPGQHVYSVTFKAIEEIDGDARRVQSVHASLRHTSSFVCVVRPKRLAITAIQGERFEAPLFVQSLADTEVRPDHCGCSFEFLTVSTDDAALTRDGTSVVWRAVAQGIAAEPGLFDGVIRLAAAGVDAPISDVPTTIRVLPQWQASPPGVAVNWNVVPPAPVEHVLQARNRLGHGRIESLTIVEPGRGVAARLEHADNDHAVIVVTLSPADLRPPLTASVRLLDAEGRVVGVVPVVVYRRGDQ
ncbi:MAG: DUF1573 domain-containing protein [Phycisphaerales bacterium]